jgi:hypothetical protein
MKILLGVLLIASNAWAQTNLGTITFTNRHGEVISNADVVKVTAIDLVYTISGSGGRAKFSELPETIQKQFGYDPDKAVEAEKAAQQRRLHDAQLLAAQARAAAKVNAERALSGKIAATQMRISGKVIQRIEAGLLVDSGSKSYRMKDLSKILHENGVVKYYDQNNVQIFSGLCLLSDAEKSKLIDGDSVSVIAYPNGIYSYAAVNGGESTVRKFTCAISNVKELPSLEEMKAIQNSGSQ